jgi:hypothetical protein
MRCRHPGRAAVTLNSGRVIAFSLLLWACSATDSTPSQGTQSDELSTSNDAASADSSALVLDVLPSDSDAVSTDEGAKGTDTTTTPDVATPEEVHAADAQDTGDDGCPIWIPADEPDYDKPAQPASSMSSCTPELPCADGEMCTLDFFLTEGVTQGACYRVCYHPKSDFPSDLGCDPSQFCGLSIRCILDYPDSECDVETGRGIESIGWCGPKSRTRGGLGGSWDANGCPCEHPFLSEEEKAACEASAN